MCASSDLQSTPTTLKELEWLHDCVVERIDYNAGPNARRLQVRMRCPDDLGYPPWEGKHLTLFATDITFMSHIVWGAVRGFESLDAIRRGISDATRKTVSRTIPGAANHPKLEFTISFHSGSSLEMLCESVLVNVED